MSEIRMYRCTACGKWSHAQRRPRSHVRYLPEYHPDLDRVPEDAIEWVENGQESDTGATIYTAKFACGPFEVWRAVRAEEAIGA